MHHIAGNMPEDTSTTMPYQRDSIKDFLKYWLSFMAWGPYQAIRYLVKRKQPRFYNPFTASEILYYIFAVGMCFVNLKATLVVFIVPFFFARLVMMLGNWTQHSFVDPNDPADELASTLICINTLYNKKCWNDGYHAFHHLRQAAHYTEYPVMFTRHLDQMATKKTFVFHGIHYLHIFTWLMMRNYDKLADHLVNINNTFSSREEAIALMKLRTKKFDL
jgi:fatty acid desaturase